MSRATAEVVLAVCLVAFAALVAFAFMIAAGEMIWQNRRRRHAHPRAIDVDLRAIELARRSRQNHPNGR